MDPLNIILPAIFIGLVIILAPIVFRSLRRYHRRMRRVAEELGFAYQGPTLEMPEASEQTGPRRWLQITVPWRLTGTREGVAVAIYLERQGSSRDRNIYSIVEASFSRPLPFTLRVSRATAFARFRKAVFGSRDIDLVSARFGPEVRVQGSDPDRIRKLLCETGVQQSILAALRDSPAFVLTEQSARWEKKGAVEDAETYRQAMELVVPVVRALKAANAFGQDSGSRRDQSAAMGKAKRTG